MVLSQGFGRRNPVMSQGSKKDRGDAPTLPRQGLVDDQFEPHITLKRFLAMKEWSYGKFGHIHFEREKSERFEYLIRFQIALLVFELFLFE